MTTINPENNLFTLINVFHVDPENQQELINLLIKATEETMQHIPGFVSANIHKGLEGQHVINYAQWESKEHFEKMLSNPKAIPHMQKVEKIIHSFNPVQTEVADSIS